MYRSFLATALAVPVAAGLLLAVPATALADEPAPPPPITLSPEQSARVCDQLVPTLLGRIDRARTTSAADANTAGSPGWLRARADQACGAGHRDLADRLTERAQRRADRVDELDVAKQRVETFRADKCRP